ncbi:MAG TPA: RNA-binding protein [Lentisphaeria bacterium]|nr:MAG: hypothetical protein A2X47_01795 [Lentisphaerae bacterium GWF2_38_69]HBM15665.1 RNA-binding protein [Lentisphaeria bacterium]
MPSTLYVGNLPYAIDGDALNKMFGAFGTVVSAKTISDSMSGRSKGFGFVEMSTSEEAENAIKELDGKDFEGRKIVVNAAKPKEDKPRRPAGAGRFGSRDGGRSGGRDRSFRR